MGRGSTDEDKPELELPVTVAPRSRDRYALVGDPKFVAPWFGEFLPRTSTRPLREMHDVVLPFNVLLLPIGDDLLVHVFPPSRPTWLWPKDDHCSAFIPRAALDCLCGLAACTPDKVLRTLTQESEIRRALTRLSVRIAVHPTNAGVLLLTATDIPLALGVRGTLGGKSRTLTLHLGTQTSSNHSSFELELDAAGRCAHCQSPACGLPDFFAQIGGEIKLTRAGLIERTAWQHDPKDRNWVHVSNPRFPIRTQWDEGNPEFYKLLVGSETFGEGHSFYDNSSLICQICQVSKCRHFRSALERHQKARSEMAAVAARKRLPSTPGPERDATRFIRSLLPGFKRRP